MLHAVNRRKARIDAFRAPGERVPLEDVVTSTVFGPLLFLDQAEAEAAVSLMLATLGVPRPAWRGPAHLELWPRRKTIGTLRSRDVEPDAEIIDASGNSLVIEVKWGAPLSDLELAAQWLSRDAEARSSSRHLLVVLEPARYQAAIDHDRRVIEAACDQPWPLHTVSWRRLADAFRAIGRDVRLNAGTRRWALAVHAFLRREDPLSLVGWEDLDLPEVPNAIWRYSRPLVSIPPALHSLAWRYDEGWFTNYGHVAASTWRYPG